MYEGSTVSRKCTESKRWSMTAIKRASDDCWRSGLSRAFLMRLMEKLGCSFSMVVTCARY